MTTDRCKSCHAPVRWVRSTAGKWVPLDPDPVANGNIVVTPVGGIAVYLRGRAPDPPDTPRYVSHFATCPHADRHRKAR